MVFDTDILIWIQRGNEKAARLVDRSSDRHISLHSYLELMQCAENKRQQSYTRSFLADLAFEVLPLTENIGHRAAIYIDQFALSHGLRAGDAIVAATAAENNLALCSSNAKHFKALPDVEFKRFSV